MIISAKEQGYNPPSGTRAIFPKDDGWYEMDSSGNTKRIASSDDYIYNNSNPMPQDVGGIKKTNHTSGFDNVPIKDIITELLYPYTKPTVTLTMKNKAGVYEVGQTVSVTKATIKITKGTKTIKSVVLKCGDDTIAEEVASDGGVLDVSNSICFDFNDEVSKTTIADGKTEETVTYTAYVTESGNDVATVEVPSTYYFVFPCYFGAAGKNVEFNDEFFENFNKKILRKSSISTFEFTTTSEQRPFFAYPKIYGEISKITDVNTNFTQKWNKNEITITASNGEVISYFVYTGEFAENDGRQYKFEY